MAVCFVLCCRPCAGPWVKVRSPEERRQFLPFRMALAERDPVHKRAALLRERHAIVEARRDDFGV